MAVSKLIHAASVDGVTSGFKNKIINGNFDIWQRGTSYSGLVARYIADRWASSSNGSQATVSREAFTVGQTEVPGNPKYFYRHQQTTTAPTPSVYQCVEGVSTFAGKTCTLSFWAKASSQRTINLEMRQEFGTGGSPSASLGHGTTVTIGTTWKRYSATFTLTSIAGKTIGTNNDDWLLVYFYNLGTDLFTFDLAQIQLEEGDIATDFEQRPFAIELILCQRYYEKSYSLESPPGTSTNLYDAVGLHSALNAPQTYVYGYIQFKVTKRKTPTVTFFNPLGGHVSVCAYDHGYNKTNSAIPTVNQYGVAVANQCGSTISMNGYYNYWVHYVADAEF